MPSPRTSLNATLLTLAVILTAAPVARSQPGELLDDLVEGLISPTQTAEESAARSAEADANFDAIMMPQNEMFEAAKRRISKGDYLSSGSAAVESLSPAPPPPRPSYVSPSTGAPAVAEVEVPLDRYADVRERLEEIRDRAQLLEGPTVTIGSAEFTGEAIQGALKLALRLQVTLGKPDGWKTVPLVGDDVVLVRGTVDGQPIPVSRRNGYHVWVTRQSGEITINLELLVPSRGPRGSLEYDFLVARTPVTRFSCRFPGEGLEPRLDAAVQSEVQSVAGSTVLDATLRPTTRIHLVGFKDLGEAEDQTARIFAESFNLLSIDEGELDLFAVVRYTILYAGAKHFDIQIPPGMTVVTADGEGAYRFTIEKQEAGGTILRGETAFPIRNNYEVSLRLKRQLDKEPEAFAAPLPRCLGVEREHGWLAVEVPGKLKLTELEPKEVLPVDVRQLPSEMVRSAVSPIIRAYRYHSSAAQVQLSAKRLPDVEPASGSVDRIRAFSVLSNEGKVLTDLRITLRNRLRPSLDLALAEDVRVRSVHLDGEAIQPSRNDDGALTLPLKKSSGGDRLRPFTLQVVTETEIEPLGILGGSALTLPAVDLPVSTVSWTVFLPSKNAYSALEGDVEPQQFATEASWHRPAYSAGPVRLTTNNAPAALAGDLPDAPESAGSGLMGVRIELPRSGTRLDYSRYWVERGQPLSVSFDYVRGWLTIPAGLVLVLLLAGGCVLFAWRPGNPDRRLRWAGVAVVALVLWPLNEIGGTGAIVLGLLLGVAAIGLRRGWLRRAPAAVADYARTLVPRATSREKGDPLGAGQIIKRSLIGAGMIVFGLMLLVVVVQLAFLMTNPL